jgi:hypothetical protein
VPRGHLQKCQLRIGQLGEQRCLRDQQSAHKDHGSGPWLTCCSTTPPISFDSETKSARGPAMMSSAYALTAGVSSSAAVAGGGGGGGGGAGAAGTLTWLARLSWALAVGDRREAEVCED